MALEQIVFNIASFNDADAGGNNYYAGAVYEIYNLNDTLADIFSDAAGSNPITQDGINNVSDSTGKALFYIEKGTYYGLVNGERRDITTSVTTSDLREENTKYNPPTIQAAIDSTEWDVNGGEVFEAQEYYSGTGGGGKWKTVLASTVIVNVGNIRQCVGVPNLAIVLQESNVRSLLSWGFDPSVTADNDSVTGLFFSNINDGDYIDFSGKMFRIFTNVTGISRAAATPATTNAAETSAIPYLYRKKNITFSAGGLYAANAGTTSVKSYYPSTLSLRECEGIHFEDGSTFESKGESWGDTDDSFTETFERRGEFIATNGGHAIACIASRTITGSPTARLSGSVGPLYFSSCDDVRLSSPFSNPASLGYAAYSADSWVGDLTYVGFGQFHHHIENPIAHKETLFRREDGITPVGSSVYCGKGGVITEDRDVVMSSTDGFVADMYANGTAKKIGYAFAAGSGSSNINKGCTIRRCQEVAYIFWSVDAIAVVSVLDMDAVVGLAGIMINDNSFGTGISKLTGKLRIDSSRVWPEETEELANTSIVACLKQASAMRVTLNLDAGPYIDNTNVKTGSIFSLINNITNLCYGGVFIEGGAYETAGYLIRSTGWGGSVTGSNSGLVISSGVKIKDTSTAALDGFINYKNQKGVAFTYVYHDLEGADISVNGFRSLNSGYTITGTGLIDKLLFPRKLRVTTYSTSAYRPRETLKVRFTSVDSLTGPNSKMNFVMEDGRVPVGPNCYITSDSGLIKVLAIYTPTVTGPLRCALMLEGDVRSLFTAEALYTILGG